MIRVFKDSKLLIRVGGRSFAVVAVADTDADANRYMSADSNAGVIAVVRGLVILAALDDAGTPNLPDRARALFSDVEVMA